MGRHRVASGVSPGACLGDVLGAPDIVDKIIVIWLGGHALEWPDTRERRATSLGSISSYRRSRLEGCPTRRLSHKSLFPLALIDAESAPASGAHRLDFLAQAGEHLFPVLSGLDTEATAVACADLLLRVK